MGFDLYGNGSRLYDAKEFPIYTKYKNLDWDEREKHIDWEKESNTFWEQEHAIDRANGTYFRANVWWWRRLWDFTCRVCDDVMEEWEQDAGAANDGIEIKEETCLKMVPLMEAALKDGSAMKYQKAVKEYMDAAPKDENGCYEEDHWMANYPFDVEFFQDFITFVKRSQGFTIS